MDEGNKNILRLHAGQDYAGWVLRAVERRAAKFEKGKTIARLSLPASREEQQPTVLVGGAAAAGAKSDRNGISVAPAAQAQVAASPPVLPERRRRD
jgi:hypothetical protein